MSAESVAELTKHVPKEAGDKKEHKLDSASANIDVPNLLESGHNQLMSTRIENRNNIPTGFPTGDSLFTGISPQAFRPESDLSNCGPKPNARANDSAVASEKFDVSTSVRVGQEPFKPLSGRTQQENVSTSIADETRKLESLTSSTSLGTNRFGPFERAQGLVAQPIPEQTRSEVTNKVIANMSPEERKSLTSELANYRAKVDDFYNGNDRVPKMFVNSLAEGPQMSPAVKDYYDKVAQEMRNRGLNRDWAAH